MKPLDWGGILFFAVFLFSPLLTQVGAGCTTVIICVGLLSMTAVRIVKYVMWVKYPEAAAKVEEKEKEEEEDGSWGWED